MRHAILAAALCLAGPALAHQPDPDSLGRAAMQQILANQGEVLDYTLVLAHGPMRIPAYLHRDGGLWNARFPTEHPMAEALSMAVQMPVLASEVLHGDDDVTDVEADARYAGIEDVDYTTRDGLTLPTRTRIRMAGDVGLSPRERDEARASLDIAREELETMEEEVASQVRVVMEWMEGLLDRGEMDVAVRVEDIQVNSGPPAWLESGEES